MNNERKFKPSLQNYDFDKSIRESSTSSNEVVSNDTNMIYNLRDLFMKYYKIVEVITNKKLES